MPDPTDDRTTILVDPKTLPSFEEAQRKLAAAREQADRIGDITDRTVAGEAADALKVLRFAREDVEKARKGEKQPYIDTGKRIDADFKELGSTNSAAEESLKDRLFQFEDKERQEREAERKRIEKNQRERQARENKKAEEEQRQSRHVPAPPPPPPPPSGARGGFAKTVVSEVWAYEITDEGQLPDEYLTKTPNRRLIKAHVEAGVSIAGVRAWKEKRMATR